MREFGSIGARGRLIRFHEDHGGMVVLVPEGGAPERCSLVQGDVIRALIMAALGATQLDDKPYFYSNAYDI